MESTKTIKKLEIPKEFKKDNMLRRLLKFESGIRDVAMYEVLRENWQFGSGHRGYEVMIIRYTTKDQEYYGSVTPAGSPVLPSNEQFGQSGWHFVKYQSALDKFNQLLTEPLGNRGKKSSVIFI